MDIVLHHTSMLCSVSNIIILTQETPPVKVIFSFKIILAITSFSGYINSLSLHEAERENFVGKIVLSTFSFFFYSFFLFMIYIKLQYKK